MYKSTTQLTKIANILYINTQHISNFGLFHGKLGIAIFFFHYYHYTKNTQYLNFSNSLIDEIFQNITSDFPLNIATGLAGIGWGFSYLEKQQYISTDKSLLKEVDQILIEYNESTFYKELHDTIPLFSTGIYFVERGNIAITDKICKFILDIELFSKPLSFPLIYINSVLFFLYNLIIKNEYTKKHEKLFELLLNKSLKSLSNKEFDFLELIFMNKTIEDISKIIRSKKNTYNDIKDNISDILIQARLQKAKFGYYNLLYNIKILDEYISPLLDIVQEKANISKVSDLCLFNGLAGIGLELTKSNNYD